MKVNTAIIPLKQHFVGHKDSLDLEAICTFVAIGFFLDNDTYFKGQKVISPAVSGTIDEKTNTLTSQHPYFSWHYAPRDISFDQAVKEFQELFEHIVEKELAKAEVILPLSGGLDSRTLAAALKRHNVRTTALSYEFTHGHPETTYAKKIAKVCNFPFHEYKVPKGYLWHAIEDLAEITQCYSEFTNPRQMAFMDQYQHLGNAFALGHWGDVLFDDMKVSAHMNIDEQVAVLIKKLKKPNTFQLAQELWSYWGLKDTFLSYLKNRIYRLLREINIVEDANAQIRAFKSMHWAPRWTAVNMQLFAKQHPISAPYFSNAMCEFICGIPEAYLANRQIQIAYLKKYAPELARIAWQDHKPFNLYSYKYNKAPFNLPFRVLNKLKRMSQSGPYIQRNWELQFLGTDNQKMLEHWLFNNDIDHSIPLAIREAYFQKFYQGNYYEYSYPVSMLLTLSLFNKLQSE